MPAARALLLFLLITAFLLIGVPLQWLVAHLRPDRGWRIPVPFCRAGLRILRVTLIVEGGPRSDGPVLLTANHVSWIDVVVLGATGPFCFLAKSEIALWPVISTLAKAQMTVFADRRRRRSIPGTNRAMAARMREGRPMLIFPEGTTFGANGPGPFKTSHYAAVGDFLRGDPLATAAVQPVAIDYSSDTAAWVGDDDLLSHLWRTLRAPPLLCRLNFGAPIACETGFDRKRVAHKSREAVLAMLPLRSKPARSTMTFAAIPAGPSECVPAWARSE